MVVVGTKGAGVCYTLDAVQSTSPTWYQLNDVDGGDDLGTDYTWIDSLVMDPLSPSFNLACIATDTDAAGEPGKIFTNDGWRDGNDWVESLT